MVRGSRSCPHCSEAVWLRCGWNVNIALLGHGSVPLGGFLFWGTLEKGGICFSLKALSKFLQVVTLQFGAVIFLVITS